LIKKCIFNLFATNNIFINFHTKLFFLIEYYTMTRKTNFILRVLLFSFLGIYSQEYLEMMNSNNFTVQEIQKAAKAHFEIKGTDRGTGYKSFKRWEYNALRMQDEKGFLKAPSFYFEELERYNAYKNKGTKLNQMKAVAGWEELGPTNWSQTTGWNPGIGRITSIAIDASNENHIIVGSPGGGVWKTTDRGVNWSVLTDNLSNIYVYSLTIDPTNSNIYYWGSGSGIIFKSIDAGATWNLFADFEGGTVNKILVDPSNSNRMFCSSGSNGIYKSFDAGLNWDLIHPDAVNGYDIEFKPGDFNTIYASGNVFFKSTDGGVTFLYKDSFSPWIQEHLEGRIRWEKTTSNGWGTVYPKEGALMAQFTYHSYAHPITRLVTPVLDLTNATSPQLNFSFSNLRWHGNFLNDFRVLYKTSTEAEWVELYNNSDSVSEWLDITLPLPEPSDTYYIAFEATNNYGKATTLDAISVEDTSLGIIFENGFEIGENEFLSGPKMIGVSAENPEIVYVLEASGSKFGGFYKSTNSGSDFTKANHTDKNYFGYSSTADDSRGQAPRDMDIIVNPSDAEDVHIAGILSWRSTNGGTDFNITSQWVPENAVQQNIGYCHADIDIMIYQNDKIYVGSDGGIFVANDPLNVSSTYYTDLSSGLGIRQFYKIGISQTDPVIVSGGSQDNGTSLYRADGNWIDWLGADGMETFVDHSDANIIYGTSQLGHLYKTVNQGQNYSGLQRPEDKEGSWVTPFEQDPQVSTTIYTGYDEVYKSEVGGNSGSWVSISQNFGSNLNHLKIAPSNSSVMYAAQGASLYKTDDGGSLEDWTALSGFSGNINSIAVHPLDPMKVAIAVNASEKVYTSNDGGATWLSVLHNLPDFSPLALVWDASFGEDILYLGMNYGVYYLRENAVSWGSYGINLPNVRISELEINTADSKLYVATYGRGLWRVDLFNPASLGVAELPVFNLNIIPNPTTGVFNLNLDSKELVILKIYDTLGKLVFYEKNRDLMQNSQIRLALPQGLYFLKVNVGNNVITKKLVIK
jgi:photosystem II stability/assembly factor-like uncharacterized protein